MISGRPLAVPRTSYQIVTPPVLNVRPGPLGAAGAANTTRAPGT
jgi:hypothetical protein